MSTKKSMLALGFGCGLVASTIAGSPTTEDNMNGEYMLAATPNGTIDKWSTNFKDYPGGVESFTFYAGPVTSTYGEVFWTSLPQVDLPADIVQRFNGKGMAIVGFESDQVRRTPQGDVSVPINIAYNHHYGATLLGSGSSMRKVPYDPDDGGRTHLLTPEPGWDRIAVEHTPSEKGLPTSLWCGYSNGGEFRKSYHALAPPFVQVIESPEKFDMTPMQIDTWNRDKMNLTGGKFVAGPAPKKRFTGLWPEGSDGAEKWPSGSLAPTTGPDAVYSGLLECPLTTRIQKQLTGGGWEDSYAVNILANNKGSCPEALTNATSCFAAAHNISLTNNNNNNNNNSNKNTRTIVTAEGTVSTLPSGCTVQVNATTALVYFNHNDKSEVMCGEGVDRIEGFQDSLVDLGLAVSVSEGVTITLSGPANGNWFGVGFDTQVMAGSPYAIIVDGNGDVTERVLGDHAAGQRLNASVTLVNNTVVAGVRTVVVTRPLQGATSQHYTFNPKQMGMDFISAVGATPAFGYHKARTASSVSLWPRTPPPTEGGVFGLFRENLAGSAEMRNDWTGEVGYSVTPTQAVKITALGRAVPAGEKALQADAVVNVWSVASKTVVASVTVGPAAGAPENGFAYANLSTPVLLNAGAEYYFTQMCTRGMPDKFSNSALNAPALDLGVGMLLGNGVYSPDGSAVNTFPTSAESTQQFAGIATARVVVPPNENPAPATACVCKVPAQPFGKGTGTIKYVDPKGIATGTIGFPPRCDPYPRETILRDHNPTCDIRTYVGGLSTCHHGWHLLDADQEVPWADQELTYYFKWRFYFQEYDETQHTQAYGWNTGIGGDTAEYDVPQCDPGTPADQCTHEISGVVAPPDGDMHFVGAHYHCHAPTCLLMEIYNNETGELLCREKPYHGQGNDVTGTDRFDEEGYIAQRVCLWANSTYGLEPPPKVGGVPLFIRAVTNNTYGHHGEMALPQMLVADLK